MKTLRRVRGPFGAAFVAAAVSAAVSAASVRAQSKDAPPSRPASAPPASRPETRRSSPSPSAMTEAAARADLEDLRAALEAAVGRARHSGSIGSPGGRVYRLHDYGAMIVLAPRTLAARRIVVRHMPKPSPMPPTVAVQVPVDPFEMVVDLSDLQRELERQMAAQALAVGDTESAQREWTRAREEEVRRYVRLVEEQAEAFRAEAERARQQAEREVRTRLAPLPPPAPPSPGEPAPSAEEAPGRPSPLPVPVIALPPVPPAAAAVATVAEPEPPEPPDPPDALDAPPPWRFWFEPGADIEGLGPGQPDLDDLEGVVTDVREKLASGLASYRRPLASLGPEESVAVAVDFVPDRLLRAQPVRTLLVRVRARDLRERQAGRLSPAEFRDRLEFGEN